MSDVALQPLHAIHLCSGYGGFELGLELAGVDVRTVCHVERDAYAATTLMARMEDEALDPAPIWSDLLTFDGRPWSGRVDLITAGLTLDERFDLFHQANPWVADRLEQMTDELVAKGASKVGVKMLFEVLRWQSYGRTVGDDWKLNNSYCSRYARLLIERRPEWANLFELRRLHSGGVS